jgi:hypothetical protein
LSLASLQRRDGNNNVLRNKHNEKGRKSRGGKAQRSMSQVSFQKGYSQFCRNVKLLSFGMDEEAGHEDEPMFRKKPIFRPERMPNYISANVITDHFTVVDKPTNTMIPDFVVQSGPSTATNDVSLEPKETKVPNSTFMFIRLDFGNRRRRKQIKRRKT